MGKKDQMHSPPYPYQYENKILLLNSLILTWAVPGDSPLLQGGLD